MKKIIRKIKSNLETAKLFKHKIATSVALRIVTRKRKIEGVNLLQNVSYGKDRLQKYDILFPDTVSTAKLPVVFYVHGGAWCSGNKFGYTQFCSKLVCQNYVCININYRLMPKVKLATTVSDCVKAIAHFCKNSSSYCKKMGLRINLNKVFMAGDSAGAHIVSLIAGKQSTHKLNLPINIIGLGLYYGVFDFNNLNTDPSPIMQQLNGFWHATGQASKTNYKKLSPTTYVTHNYPPCFITTGEVDKLHYQSTIFKHLLDLNGVEMKYLSFDKSRQDGMHAFLNMPIWNSAKEAFSELSKFWNKQRHKRRKKNEEE